MNSSNQDIVSGHQLFKWYFAGPMMEFYSSETALDTMGNQRCLLSVTLLFQVVYIGNPKINTPTFDFSLIIA